MSLTTKALLATCLFVGAVVAGLEEMKPLPRGEAEAGLVTLASRQGAIEGQIELVALNFEPDLLFEEDKKGSDNPASKSTGTSSPVTETVTNSGSATSTTTGDGIKGTGSTSNGTGSTAGGVSSRKGVDVNTDEEGLVDSMSAFIKRRYQSRLRWDKRDKSPNYRRIERGLLQLTRVKFNDVPLKDALNHIEQVHQIPIYIEQNQIEKEDATVVDRPINLELKGLCLEDILQLLLNPLGLDYVIKNDLLVITTRAANNEYTETRFYDTKEIGMAPAELMNLIKETVDPDGWNEVARVRPAREGLVIRQSQRVHNEIVELLEQLLK